MKKGKSTGSRGRAAAVAAPPEVAALVERFRENLDSYRDPAYKEARLRREFLDPFFEALGWDLQNKAGHAEAYKDVVHEDALKVGGSTEAPDYGFRVGGQRKFFVEAKKPSVSVGTDVHPAYQLRRYAWSAKLSLAILTDFEELAVYDCRVRPRRSDKPSTARILYMTFEEYAERWGEIAAIFSKDAVLKGSFDRFAEKGRGRGTATVDEAFLEEIEGWREHLARNLALRNPRLSVRDLNAAVQRTIDRIIFLRMCEDRGIEPGGALLALVNGSKIYERLVALFERADDKYNSGLFHFRREPGRAEPDELTPRLRVDDGVLADIIRSLYYPESPYEFSVLGADILGQVYEQFLGKVIRLTAGHHAKVEEKPEVKKAGGVYYTPTYIVRYIVEETVGRLLPPIGKGDGEEKGTGVFCRNGPSGASHKILPSPFPQKTPVPFSPREASRLRILDPACGSGSFLIGAFERLLDWHRDWYVADGPEKHAKEIYRGAGGEWRLTVREKRRILLNNIFGVDIDGQAVEVTKLSLLLKVLEGENQDSLERQMRLFHEERALPDLASNIKCGNSLIGPDFFDGRQMDLFGDEEVYRVNAFDWETQFPAILGPKVPKKRRGFDAVIGNPPYLNVKRAFFTPAEKQYLEAHCETARGQWDTFVLFSEKALKLLSHGGLHAFILPKPVLVSENYEVLRRKYYGNRIACLADAGQPFAQAGVESVVIVIQSGAPGTPTNVVRVSPSEVRSLGVVRQDFCASLPFGALSYKVHEPNARILQKITRAGRPLGELLGVFTRGIEAGKDCGAIHDRGSIQGAKALLTGEDVSRYSIRFRELFFNPARVPQRIWKDRELYEVPEKILLRRVANRIHAALDTHGYWVLNTLYILCPREPTLTRWLVGLLNSRLLSYWFSSVFLSDDKLFPYLRMSQLGQLPVQIPPVKSAGTSPCQDRMVALVERMLDLNERLAKARSVEARGRLQRLIDRTDREIDALVYELYGLTEEEIGIVEELRG